MVNRTRRFKQAETSLAQPLILALNTEHTAKAAEAAKVPVDWRKTVKLALARLGSRRTNHVALFCLLPLVRLGWYLVPSA
ncbi:hypothetical protein E4U55_000069 [Claviceps digitariae]|nr:hypothetical protein E4U55_000069 [Claviceps digitariae]